VLPNYRLIPESNGADILEDLSDFWTWFKNKSVTTYLASKNQELDIEYEKLLVTGDSAGGYMALMSALTQPKSGIKAILAQYPMTQYMRLEPSPTFFGMPAPGPEVVEQHIANVTPGTVVSSAVPPARAGLSYSLAAYNNAYLKYFGPDEKMWPFGALADASEMPPTWIIHGDQDQAVSVGDSQAFVKRWTEKEVRGEVRLDVLPGMDHGFDIGLNEGKWLE
jgi:acetyl esterase/lipase